MPKWLHGHSKAWTYNGDRYSREQHANKNGRKHVRVSVPRFVDDWQLCQWIHDAKGCMWRQDLFRRWPASSKWLRSIQRTAFKARCDILAMKATVNTLSASKTKRRRLPTSASCRTHRMPATTKEGPISSPKRKVTTISSTRNIVAIMTFDQWM